MAIQETYAKIQESFAQFTDEFEDHCRAANTASKQAAAYIDASNQLSAANAAIVNLQAQLKASQQETMEARQQAEDFRQKWLAAEASPDVIEYRRKEKEKQAANLEAAAAKIRAELSPTSPAAE